ncbi:MAG TPA: DUF4245 domain-containing protein [Streptosporangiaceae bacterium]
MSAVAHPRRDDGWGRLARAIVVCVLLTAVVVVITPRRTSAPGPMVDYRADAARLRAAAAFPAYAPVGVPRAWWPVQSRLSGVGAPPLAWSLDYVLPGGAHAALEESDEPYATFASRMANVAAVSGAQRIGRTTWERRFRADKDQRSLVRRSGPATLVVTGTASWSDLTVLARSLRT